MPRGTSPISYPPSSSSHMQTPALDHSRFRNDASASSSPIADVLSTPKDDDVSFSDSTLARGRAPKWGKRGDGVTRRTSVRVRASSSNGGLESSPNQGDRGGLLASIESENPQIAKTAAVAPQPPLTRQSSAPSTLPHSRSRTRASLPARQIPPPSSDFVAQAQAHGITPDQFEQAKAQFRNFLRTDTPVLSEDKVPQAPPKTRQQQAAARSSARSASVTPTPTFPSNTSSAHDDLLETPRDTLGSPAPVSRRPTPAVPATPTAPSIADSPAPSQGESAPSSNPIPQCERFDSIASSTDADGRLTTPSQPSREVLKEVRSRPSLEEIAERSGERKRRETDMRKERDVRMWAEEGGEESSSSDDSINHVATMTPRTRTAADLARGPLPGIASLLPSPSFEPQSPFQQSPFQQPSAARGMMERFLSDRDLKDGGRSHSPEAHGLRSPHYAVDRKALLDLEDSPRLAPINSHSPHALLSSPLSAPRLASTASPPAKSLPFSPNAMMTSPAPSRPGIFFSPDVAKLLRSELDELNSSAARKSPTENKRLKEGDVHMTEDEEFSSPFRPAGYDESPTITPNGVKRHRDIFGSGGLDSGKRSRWSDHTNSDDRRPLSPSPSTTSVSLRAPSFCDSSPALSERASTAGGSIVRHSYPLSAHPHPASAPDFYHHGLPSSSPASSQNSYSDYAPPAPRHRSSPGPVASTSAPTLIRANSAVTMADANLARKRAPIKRADTSPAIMGPEGYAKPGWSYAALIGQAIFSTETRKISLADIYTFIMTCYPYYKKEDSGWQNSIRHNLSLNECFIKTARGIDNPGKGCLWAIAAGCEEQFADGGFTKKGAAAQGRKNSKARTPLGAPTKFDPLARSSLKRGRDDSPASSSRDASPAPSMVSSREIYRPPYSHQVDLPAVRPHEASEHSPTPPPPPQTRTEGRLAPGERNVAAVLRRRESANSMSSAASASVAPASATRPISQNSRPRSPSPEPAPASAPTPILDEPAEKKLKMDGLAPPYVPRQTASTPADSLALSQSSSRRHAFTSPVAASPPTSVYHRLAAPYQPANYSQPSAQSHRALALLASPEPSGIMPVHPSIYDRSALLPSSSPDRQPHPHLQQSHAHFLPAPQIFPSSSRRNRSDSEEKEMKPPQTMLSPTAMVHSQSPISSVRGGPRAPMSPVQHRDDSGDEDDEVSDPEKKRAHGLRHIPAVAALAGDSSHDTFRSPPRNLRSPTSRSLQSVGALQAAMATPGSRRPWGTPGRFGASPGMADGTWGWGDPFSSSVEAELELLRDDVIGGSGTSTMGPRLYWPSPSAPTSGTIAW